MLMDTSELSLTSAFSRENLETEDPHRFSLYVSLIRVGISISFAGLGASIISLILFAPSLVSVPLGQTGKVLLGLFTSIVSFKIYQLFKLSNTTVLAAGRTVVGVDSLWRKSTRTTTRRIVVIILSVILSPSVLVGGFTVFGFVTDSTSGYTDGVLSELGTGGEVTLFISILAFNAGIVTISLGLLLVFWALLTPLRSALYRGFRFGKIKSKMVIYDWIENLSGVSLYTPPEKICDKCFSTSFKMGIENDEPKKFLLLCSHCGRQYGTISNLEKLNHDADPKRFMKPSPPKFHQD